MAPYLFLKPHFENCLWNWCRILLEKPQIATALVEVSNRTQMGTKTGLCSQPSHWWWARAKQLIRGLLRGWWLMVQLLYFNLWNHRSTWFQYRKEPVIIKKSSSLSNCINSSAYIKLPAVRYSQENMSHLLLGAQSTQIFMLYKFTLWRKRSFKNLEEMIPFIHPLFHLSYTYRELVYTSFWNYWVCNK
jgi:hypothetical protein